MNDDLSINDIENYEPKLKKKDIDEAQNSNEVSK